MSENTPPATDTTGSARTNEGNQEGGQQQRSNDNNRNRGSNNSYRRGNGPDQAIRNFKGTTPEINATLSLPNERVNLDKGFEYFQDELKNYILKEIKNATDVLPLVSEFVDPNVDFIKNHMPSAPFSANEVANDPMKKTVNDQIAKDFASRIGTLRDNVTKIYALIWGQCTSGVHEEIKSKSEYDLKSSSYDALWLLKQVKIISAGVITRGNSYENMLRVLQNFMENVRQGRNESEESWFRRFKAECDTLKVADVDYIFYNETAAGHKNLSTPPTDDEIKTEMEACKAMFFLKFSNHLKYPELFDFLMHSDMVGSDQYPKTLTEVYELLLQHNQNQREDGFQGQHPRRQNRNAGRGGNRGNHNGYRVSFLQRRNIPEADRNNPVAGTDGQIIDRQCYRCHAYGHLSFACPNSNGNTGAHSNAGGNRNVQALQIGISLTQQQVQGDDKLDIINDAWILLDTCSTDSVIKNQNLVSNIEKCNDDEVLKIHTNGGHQLYTHKGTLKFLPLDVHVNENSMANILSLKDVANIHGVRITMDTAKDRSIIVHSPDGLAYVFLEASDGLYYFDTSSPCNHIKTSDSHYCFLSTVLENKNHFTRAQIAGADKSREIQAILGWPSTNDFKTIVAENHIKNSPITIDDIDRATYIYGEPLPVLQGKMTRIAPVSKPASFSPIPLPILEHNNKIHLYVDFFFVNNMAFMHTKSKNINFLSVQYCTSRNALTIKNSLRYIKSKYESRGFSVEHIHADNEFNVQGLDEELSPTNIHIYAAREHVGVIERSIRTIKERCRCIAHAMPFKRHPKLLTRSMIEFVVSRLNALPSKNGISSNISPATLILGKGPIDCKYKTVEFGSGVMLYTSTENNLRTRSIPCIALNPTNEFGGHNFLSLETGRKLHGYHWESVPLNDWMIERVETLAKDEKQPALINKTPLFEWQPGVPISENQGAEDEHENVPANEEELQISDEEEEENEIYEDEVSLMNEVTDESSESSEEQDNDETVYESGNEYTIDEETGENEEENSNHDEINETNADAAIEAHQDIETTTNDEEDDTDTVRRSERTNRGQGVERLEMSFKGKTYSKSTALQFITVAESTWPEELLHPKLKQGVKKESNRKKALQFLQKSRILLPEKNSEKNDYLGKALHVLFTQMSAKQGFRQIGEEAVAAIFKEFKQLDEGPMPGKKVIIPIDADSLTEEMKKRALEVVNLIKLKKSGRVKGRSCLNGSKQRRYLGEYDSVASPTASLEGILSSFVVDAYEKRDVAIFDVPGAYLHAKFPDDEVVVMKLRDEFVDIMCRVNPEYLKYVQLEKGKKVLYLRVIRALYGAIQSALLWYNLFSETLEDMGFVLNPYDRCVANKMVDGKQLTIVWYVDDCKVSHVDPNVVSDFIDKMKQHFGELTITRGKKHTFLGMNFNITDDGLIELDMVDQIQEAIEAFGEIIDKAVATPAKQYLFDVREDAELLDKNKADIFHSVTAKLLFISKRVRPDIETAISFLTTRVSCSNVDDWQKLKRVLQFLYGTINDKRIIGADGLADLYTWIDASYAIHPNMRSHTGGCMSLGRGTLHTKSSKQKLNTKSSTEAELVGASEYLPYNIWLISFLKEQGYDLRVNNTLYQDNQSAIKMELNGRNSCTGNSRHIDIRYFFVKDRVDKKEIQIEYCPTEYMLADFFTKALQGKKFTIFRDVLMGYKHINTLSPHSLKERVEVPALDTNAENRNVRHVKKRVSYADIVKGKPPLPFTKKNEEKNKIANTSHSFQLIQLDKQ